MFFKRLLIVVALLVLGLCLPLVSHAQDEAAEEIPLFLGTVTGLPDEFVGLAIDGENVTLYICDGQPDKGTITIAQWFVGTITNNLIDITAPNGNRVEVTIDGDTATGTFTFTDGTTKDFVLTLADGDAALYRSEFTLKDIRFVGGWLVLEDGSVRGGIFDTSTSELTPAGLVGYGAGAFVGSDDDEDSES